MLATPCLYQNGGGGSGGSSGDGDGSGGSIGNGGSGDGDVGGGGSNLQYRQQTISLRGDSYVPKGTRRSAMEAAQFGPVPSSRNATGWLHVQRAGKQFKAEVRDCINNLETARYLGLYATAEGAPHLCPTVLRLPR